MFSLAALLSNLAIISRSSLSSPSATANSEASLYLRASASFASCSFCLFCSFWIANSHLDFGFSSSSSVWFTSRIGGDVFCLTACGDDPSITARGDAFSVIDFGNFAAYIESLGGSKSRLTSCYRFLFLLLSHSLSQPSPPFWVTMKSQPSLFIATRAAKSFSCMISIFSISSYCSSSCSNFSESPL